MGKIQNYLTFVCTNNKFVFFIVILCNVVLDDVNKHYFLHIKRLLMPYLNSLIAAQ